jgi:hypothetical protein
MKKKKLVKQALQEPYKYSSAEIAFFQRWLQEKKNRKQQNLKK